MKTKARIACIGEVMIELIAGEDNLARLDYAGDTYNTAVYLSQLLDRDRFSVHYVTALGSDRYSQGILDRLCGYGIETGHVEIREDRLPGIYSISVDEAGERSFTYWRNESAAKTLFEEPCQVQLQSLSTFDVVYLSGISLAILPPETRRRLVDFLVSFRNNGGKVAFDSNYRPRLWENMDTARQLTAEMWSIADIALPSVDDEMALFSDPSPQAVLERLARSGVRQGALKRGASGPVALDGSKTSPQYQTVPRIVDSTAAGDSFNAGFIASWLADNDLETAMQAGHAIASEVIQAQGAIVDIKTALDKAGS